MAWSDDWGNEYPTYEAAVEGIHQMIRENSDRLEVIAEFMGIPTNLLEFIYAHCKDAFETEYREIIKDAEDDWCEYYIDNLEEFE